MKGHEYGAARFPCPLEDVWAEVAAGVFTGDKAEALLAHAAECSSCAVLLKQMISALHSDACISKDSAPPSLMTSPEFSKNDRRELAQRMAQAPLRTSTRRWLYAAAALLAPFTGLLWFFTRTSAHQPLQQLASAYTANRTLELRIPEAAYGPLRSERGARLDAAPELFEAQAAVARRLAANPEDVSALHAKARSEILLWQFDSAIRTFEAAEQLGAATPEFYVDHATAYFQRGESNGAPVDFSRAVELLSTALARQPRHSAALYNRAVLFSRLNLFDNAIADLEASLQVEKDPGWRAEAQKRLVEIRQKRARMFDDVPQNPEMVEERTFEALLAAGLRTIPDELPERLLNHHGDRWLTDASLTTGISKGTLDILGALARIRLALDMAAYGGHDKAIAELQATRLPEPLAVWRDFELLFRTTHGQAPENCSGVAALRERARTHQYAWFLAQTLLEESTCLTNSSDMAQSAAVTKRAIAIAHAAHFPALEIRARGFDASHAVNEGRYRESFRMDWETLETLAKGGYPPRRIAQSYSNLMRASERMERWNTAGAASAMLANAAERAGWAVTVMGARSRRARHARSAGDPTAEQRFAEALAATASLPWNRDTATYHAVAQTGLLESRNDRDGLLGLLRNVGQTRNLIVHLPLWIALAKQELRHNDPAGAIRWLDRLTELEATLIPAKDGPRTWRRELTEAGELRTLALLQQGRLDASLEAWHQHLGREWTQLSSRPHKRNSSDSPTVTVARLQDRIGIWTAVGPALRFHWAALSAAEYERARRRVQWLCSNPARPFKSIQAAVELLAAELLADVPSGAEEVALELQRDQVIPVLLLAKRAKSARSIWVVPFGNSSEQWTGAHRALLVEGTRIHPTFRSDSEPLPGLDEEAAALARSVATVRRLSGDEATAARISADARDADLIHFAGHARRWKTQTALLVAPDAGAASEAARLGVWAGWERLPCMLAVFAACSTAAYVETDTVSSGHLAEQALGAGARYVVASLWDVNSAASARLMSEFYAALRRVSPRRALVEAAHRVRTTPGFEHPYYWAAFVLYQSP